MKIYVGNLSYEVTEEDLRLAFEPFGQVDSAELIKDKFTGKSKGFAFVEMPSKDEAESAITGLNEKEIKGRTIKVNEARPRTENRGGKGRFSGRKEGYGGKGGYHDSKGGFGGRKGGTRGDR